MAPIYNVTGLTSSTQYEATVTSIFVIGSGLNLRSEESNATLFQTRKFFSKVDRNEWLLTALLKTILLERNAVVRHVK